MEQTKDENERLKYRLHEKVGACSSVHRLHGKVCVCLFEHRLHEKVGACSSVHRLHRKVCVCLFEHTLHEKVGACSSVHRLHDKVCVCSPNTDYTRRCVSVCVNKDYIGRLVSVFV